MVAVAPRHAVRKIRSNQSPSQVPRSRTHRLCPAQRFEVFRKGGPVPADPVVQRRARDVLDRDQDVDELGAICGPARREPNPAVPEHQGRHAVPKAPNWSQHRIPSTNRHPISMGTK